MLKIRTPAITPPSGWRFMEPVTSQPFRDDSLSEIVRRISTHCTANEVPPFDVEAAVINETAAWLVDHGHADLVVHAKPIKRGFVEAWRGMQAFARMRDLTMKGEPVFVSQEMANKRAAVCAQCAFNVVASNTSPVFIAQDAIMGALVQGRTTAHDDALGHCEACTCRCKVIVHMTTGLLGAPDPAKLPGNCWKMQPPQ